MPSTTPNYVCRNSFSKSLLRPHGTGYCRCLVRSFHILWFGHLLTRTACRLVASKSRRFPCQAIAARRQSGSSPRGGNLGPGLGQPLEQGILSSAMFRTSGLCRMCRIDGDCVSLWWVETHRRARREGRGDFQSVDAVCRSRRPQSIRWIAVRAGPRTPGPITSWRTGCRARFTLRLVLRRTGRMAHRAADGRRLHPVRATTYTSPNGCPAAGRISRGRRPLRRHGHRATNGRVRSPTRFVATVPGRRRTRACRARR